MPCVITLKIYDNVNYYRYHIKVTTIYHKNHNIL